MTMIRIDAGPFTFTARMEVETAPKTCAKFSSMLPYRQKIIHVRWSGEGCWIPLASLDLGLTHQNATSHPAPGKLLLYPTASTPTPPPPPHAPPPLSTT